MIAVCIASYNYAQFLPELFNSLVDQTFRDFVIMFHTLARRIILFKY